MTPVDADHHELRPGPRMEAFSSLTPIHWSSCRILCPETLPGWDYGLIYVRTATYMHSAHKAVYHKCTYNTCISISLSKNWLFSKNRLILLTWHVLW